MAPQSHIVSSYEAELADLDSKISRMGGMTEQLLANGFDALIKRDPALAERVISSDRMVDEYNREIEENAILVIAKRQPMAVDLRQIMAAMRVSSDLERIGDLAKNIATVDLIGGAEEDRTPDLCSAIAALSQLSYGPRLRAFRGLREAKSSQRPALHGLSQPSTQTRR